MQLGQASWCAGGCAAHSIVEILKREITLQSAHEQKQGRHPDREQTVLLGSQHSPCELQEFIFPFGAPELEFQNENHILSSLFWQKISSSFLPKLSQCCKGVKISQALAHALRLVFCVCQIGSVGGAPVPQGWG